ncbi:unnamed protein product [Haemonchus placei]|uniref:ZP domain-containing protein n=1 Tax=Haemonchus placei TaxID=6290 RepID=A0A0N4W5Z5_HAEPC|nr:unnamed protein product [Haemonchus placei]
MELCSSDRAVTYLKERTEKKVSTSDGRQSCDELLLSSSPSILHCRRSARCFLASSREFQGANGFLQDDMQGTDRTLHCEYRIC